MDVQLIKAIKQDLFNIVYQAATTMTERSTSEDGLQCRYRSADGNKCFIGRLIPDDRYDPIFDEENVASSDENVIAAIPQLDILRTERHLSPVQVNSFLTHLQVSHDERANWDDAGMTEVGIADLESIAKEHDLSIPTPL